MPAQPYPDVEAAFDALVRRVFPKAKQGEFAGVPGWSVLRSANAPRYEGGTMLGDKIFLGIAQRKAGVTVYV